MKAFFDTNILVYLFDSTDPDKRKHARLLFDKHLQAGDVLLSTQVLQEFYVTVTRKLASPLDSGDAAEVVSNFAELPVVRVDNRLILSAISRSRASRFSFWDGLILEAAIEGGAQVLYSEDMQHNQLVDTVRIVNPFTNP